MRFLFTLHPLIGHFHAMVPLALELKVHGHDVVFATGDHLAPIVKRVGFKHVSCGQDNNGTSDFLTDLFEQQDIKSKVSHPALRQLWGFIQGFGPQMTDDLIDLFKDWKPDAIVRDPTDFGGYVAADLFDLPYASIQWAVYISCYGCDEPLTALRRRYGLPDDPGFASFDRYFALNALPPSWVLQGTVPPVLHRFCMPPFDQSVRRDLPPWVSSLPDRPTIYATLGTTFNQKPDRFRALIAAFGAEDFNAIITVGQSVDPARFHPLPENVRIERYIPQTLILPYCQAFIFHGGFNSLHSALWHGLPMVIVPLEAGDQQPTAVQCAELGIGVVVEEALPEPETINAAVKTVLEQPSYQSQVHQLQQEIKELPDLSEAVHRLENLARTHEPQMV